ncbi:MAG: zf-HC2 domain-containing protein [Actinomycetota bacterium]
MTHPTEELTDYVDGTLSDEERARIDAHLADCDSCRREVAFATRGRTAMDALPQVPAPEGFVRDIGTGERSGSSASRWLGLAAAAAVILVLIGVGFGVTRDRSAPTALSAASPAADAAAPPETGPGSLNYEGRSLQALADQEAERYARTHGLEKEYFASDQTNQEATEGAWGAGSDAAPPPAASASPIPKAAALDVEKLAQNASRSRGIEDCLRRSGAFANRGTLIRTYEGDLQGIPAYFGVIAEGAQPGAVVDRIVVWVARKDGCDVIGFTQAFIIRPSPSPLPPELIPGTPGP